MQKINVAGIDVLCKKSASPKGSVMLLHGYGANADDLYSLAEMLDQQGDYDWYFPEGILILGQYSPSFFARAWFQIDIQALQSGNPRNYVDITPAGFPEAAQKVITLIEQLGLDLQKTILGGFSQGAMMSAEIALQMKKPLAGLVLLSGTLVNQKRWQSLAEEFPHALEFFQSHGRQDSILSFGISQELNTVLNRGNIKGKLIDFNGAHEIPFTVLQALQKYLREKLP